VVSDKDDNYRRTFWDDYFEFAFYGGLLLFIIITVATWYSQGFSATKPLWIILGIFIGFIVAVLLFKWLVERLAIAIGGGIRGVIKGWGKVAKANSPVIWPHQISLLNTAIVCFGVIGAIISFFVGMYDLFSGNTENAKVAFLLAIVLIPLSTIAIVCAYNVLFWIYKSTIKRVRGDSSEQTNSRRIVVYIADMVLTLTVISLGLFMTAGIFVAVPMYSAYYAGW
jgi:nitrate reductase NapE component